MRLRGWMLKGTMVLLGLGTLACAGGTTPKGIDSADSGFVGSRAGFADAWVLCDPTADTWDDLFVFEAETVGAVNAVNVEVFEGRDLIGRVGLTERATGDWYGEEWADALNSDCDEWERMLFQFIGQVDGGGVIEATVEP